MDEAMRRERAGEIATKLGDTDRWHSHGYGISMKILQDEVNLKINDLDREPECCSQVRLYTELLNDYMRKRAHEGVLQTQERYVPYVGQAQT